MTTADLKPCPFCGTRCAEFIPDSDPAFNFGGHIECSNCGARGVTCYSDEPPTLENNERLAAQHWNYRVPA